ncbi:MAG: hypothetical protein RL065_595, partial [Bacteroidota bacterium]
QQYFHGPGGGGGGGVIIFKNTTTPSGVSTNVNGGLQGLCNGNNSLETDGCIGSVLFNYIQPASIIGQIHSHQNISICKNDTAVLQLNSAAQFINWNPINNLSCNNCVAPKAYPTITTTYIATDSVNHCFSRDTFNIKVNLPTSSNVSVSMCQGNTYTLHNGNKLSTSGVYHDTISNHVGCDSIITINLLVKNKSSDTVYTAICQGSNYHSPSGKIFTVSGVYYDTITNHLGCDSIITIHLTALDSSLTIIKKTICQGKNYILPDGTNVNSSGTYNVVYVSNARCDSTLQFQITVLSNSTSNKTLFLCVGDSALLPDGNAIHNGGNYFTTIPNHNGCDSVIHTLVNMLPKFAINFSTDSTICENKSIFLNANPNNTIGGTFNWNNGINIPTIEINKAGLYIVTASFPPCKPVSDSIQIFTTNCDCNIYMPNAFSPNHDNLNETIKPIIECNPLPIDYEFSIYNRLGQKVFSTTVLDESWDGTFKNKEQEVGTYDYIFSYRVNQLSEKLKQKGDITLIR